MIYLDTSAAVPLFVPEPASDAVSAWLEACQEPLASSDVILTEFSSALSIKVRRQELSQRRADAAWRRFESFTQSGLRLLPVSRSAFALGAELARNAASGLRSGDSVHLAMAIETKARRIATADDNLADNAKKNRLAVDRF